MHLKLGMLFIEEDMFAESLHHYTEALRVRPEYLPARMALGALYGRTGRYDRAVEEFPACRLRLAPANPSAHYNLGLAHEMRGSIDEAARHYGKALELDPDHPKAKKRLERIESGGG
ncbi:MAG: tetratricopeptide repeat protein [Thermodesulfobacteriota bacterium]